MVETVGFAVDAGITNLLTQLVAVAAAPARLLALLVAVSVTWALNRRFTFQAGTGASTWLPYLVASSFGALINGGMYLLWLRWAGHSAAQIVAGVAMGSVAALTFNYTIYRRVMFRASRTPPTQ